jgi:CRP-like cAMP-binding protein
MPAVTDRRFAGARSLGNNLLRSLRSEDLALLQPSLQEWSAEAGTVLYEPGDKVEFVYFPCGQSLISFVVVLDDGRAIETALIGREGAAGGVVSQGHLPAYARAVVHFPGLFLRIPVTELENAKINSLSLRNLFARYADCVIAQVFQSVACNAAHTIEQRTVKWLLAAIDRTGGDEIPLTQDQLASMMGVGRSYVSRVIQSLKGQGVLETRRGGVRVPDLKRLGKLSCSCNSTLRRHFDQVLAGVYPSRKESARQNDAPGGSRPGGRMKE